MLYLKIGGFMIKKTTQIILFTVLIVFVLLSITPFIFSHKNKIYTSVKNLPDFDVICLLGAKVYPNNKLSPIMKQRSDTTIKLFSIYKKYIFISGSGKYEVNNIKKYLVEKGIDENYLILDYLGYDTHDTMRHLNQKFKKPLIVTQSFHLFRALEMAIDENLNPLGITAEKISPYKENLSPFNKYKIKLERHYRNSFLFWLYKFGAYDKMSIEAELKEKRQ